MSSELGRIQEDIRRSDGGLLKRLADYSPPFSPFRVLAVESRERSHSAALRFFLDPQEAHGWRDRFLKMFVSDCFPGISERVSEQAFSSARVRTEWNGLDVLAELSDNGPVIGIEVKLWAPEGDGQIAGYQEFLRQRFSDRAQWMVFLTLDGREPTTASDDSELKCVALPWARVCQLIEEMRPEDAKNSHDVQRFIDDFRENIMAMTEGDPEERRIVTDLFHDPELGQAVLKAAKIRYGLFTEGVVSDLTERIERDRGISGLEICHRRPGAKGKEYGLSFKLQEGLGSAIVFLFYDFPDYPGYGSGMHVLINGNEGVFDERAYRFAFNAEGESQNLLEAPPGWGGNWRLALPAEYYPAGTSKGWKFETDSFDDQWLDNAVKCFEEALNKIPKSLFPPSLNHA